MEDITEKIKKFVETIKNSINCQCPAQISKVNEDGTYSRDFSETYSANEDTTDEGIIGVICARCGTWNFYDEASYEIFKEDDFKNACPDCNPEYENSYDENELIKLIASYLEDEESFNKVSIFINGIHIE